MGVKIALGSLVYCRRQSVLHIYTLYFFSILLKPVTSAAAWKKGAEQIKGLADSLHTYRLYLEAKNEEMKMNHAMEHPVRTIAEDATVEHRPSVQKVNQQYSLLDALLKEKE